MLLENQLVSGKVNALLAGGTSCRLFLQLRMGLHDVTSDLVGESPHEFAVEALVPPVHVLSDAVEPHRLGLQHHFAIVALYLLMDMQDESLLNFGLLQKSYLDSQEIFFSIKQIMSGN